MKRLPTTMSVHYTPEALAKIEAHFRELECVSYEEYVHELIACDMFNGDFAKRKLMRKSLESVLESAAMLGIDPEVAEKVITDLLSGKYNKSVYSTKEQNHEVGEKKL